MDAVRAMLDELMGPNRDDPHKPKVKRNLSDKDVCPFYLCGLCPYEEFDKTKHEMGACPLVHDDDCKAQWEALPDKQRDRLGHERELQKFLDRLVGDLQKKIKRNEERLAADKKQLLLPDDQAAVQAVTEQIRDMLAQAESLGEQGQVDAAQACTQQAEALKVQKAQMEAEGYVRAGNANNRYGMQEVCPLSGVIINREETRVRDHKMGRNYRAWVNAHDKLKELQATFKRRQEEREKERAGVSGRRPADSSQDANAARQPSGSSWRPEREHSSSRPAAAAGHDRDTGRDRDRRERERGRDSSGRRHGNRERDRLFTEADRTRSGTGKSSHSSKERRRSRSRSRDRSHRQNGKREDGRAASPHQ